MTTEHHVTAREQRQRDSKAFVCGMVLIAVRSYCIHSCRIDDTDAVNACRDKKCKLWPWRKGLGALRGLRG
jgi:hypothetical protein